MPAARTDLTITSINHADSNKKVTNKLSYVNPNITNQQAVTLANMFTDLTKDTYSKTTRTDTTDCDNTIQRPITSITYTYDNNGSSATADVPADGVINITTTKVRNREYSIMIYTPYDSANLTYSDLVYTTEDPINFIRSVSYSTSRLIIFSTGTVTTGQVKFTLHIPATSQYDAWTKDFTFNITTAE